MINIPSSVRQLAFENVAHAAPLQLRVHFAAPMHEKDIIRAEGAIDDQLAAPMAIGLLLAQQILLRARDRLRDLFVVRRIRFRYVWSRARQRNEVLRRIPACRSDPYEALAAASARLPGQVSVSGAHAIEGEHLAATASRFRFRAEIEFDRFPRVSALRLQSQRRCRLVAAMHHAIFASAVARHAVDDAILSHSVFSSNSA